MLSEIKKNIVGKYPWRRLVVKTVFGAVYFLFGAEVFLRLFAPMPITPSYLCATSYGIRANAPNKNYWLTTPEYRVNMRTNSKGIRSDREIPYEKPPGLKRIVLVGDSFAMAHGVSLEESFLSHMQKFLEKAGVDCEVVHLGVPCFGNAEELIYLKEEGLKYQPDLVLLAWHPSDYSENVRSNLFGLEGGHLIRKSKAYLPGVNIREFLIQFAAYRWMDEHSHFYKFIRDFSYRYVRKPLAVWIRKVPLAIKAKPNTDNPTTEMQEDQNKQEDLYRKELTIALLKQLKRECLSNGANFLILDIPIRLSRMEFESRFPTSEDTMEQDFAVFSPIELFKQQNGKKLYWEKSEGHFTPFGCRIVGEGLAKVILSNGLLEEI